MKKFIPIGAVLLAVVVVVGLTVVAPALSGGSQGQAADTPNYKVDGANGTMVNVDLKAFETVQEIAPGVKYHVWTFDGTAPGPVIRVHLGDTIHFTLTNASTIGMQHSIDFHAAMTPWADLPKAGSTTLTGNYQPVNPGDTKSFDWVAMYPGVFMYHCGVPPVLQHISNGMYGAIVVEPEDLAPEREFVLVSSEFYPGAKPIHGVYEGDLDRMAAVDPQYVVFNGIADQYKDTPLVVQPDEPFRIWVMNAGPTLTNAFHVIGTMFNETHDTGNPANTEYGLQTYNIPPGSGAMFEMQIPDAGLYPFVTHAFAYTGLGAVGLIKVDPNAPDAPEGYPLMGDPFTAGVASFGPADRRAPRRARPRRCRCRCHRAPRRLRPHARRRGSRSSSWRTTRCSTPRASQRPPARRSRSRSTTRTRRSRTTCRSTRTIPPPRPCSPARLSPAPRRSPTTCPRSTPARTSSGATSTRRR